MKDAMLAFLDSRELCVIATASADGKPESAIVGFSHTNDLMMIIGTSKKSRKYANLTQNPRVAIVVGDREGEVQYEGRAEVIEGGVYKDMVEQAHIAKLPGAAEYREDPNQAYIKISPTWIRFLKHGADGGMEEFIDF